METINYNRRLSKIVEKGNLKTLSKLNSMRSLSSLAMEWLLVVAAIWLCERYWHVAIYIVTIMFLAARMHAIGTLAHDATHFLVLKNRKMNDKVAEWFITWPLFYSFHQYRKYHFEHHAHLNTEKDPDVQRHKTYREFQFPLKKTTMAWIILKDISGVNYFIYRAMALSSKNFWKNLKNTWNWEPVIYYAVLFAALYYFGWHVIFLKYWMVAFVTWLQFIQRVRTIAEHNAAPKEALIGTRTTIVSAFDRMFFGPKNTNYHVEHHLYPNIPFFNLPRLHQILMKNREFKKSVHLTRGYLNVIKECLA